MDIIGRGPQLLLRHIILAKRRSLLEIVLPKSRQNNRFRAFRHT